MTTGRFLGKNEFCSATRSAARAAVRASMALALLLAFDARVSGAAVACGTTAACGGTTRNWQPDNATSNWFDNINWVDEASGTHSTTGGAAGDTQPNSSGENACIKSDWFTPDYAAIGGGAPPTPTTINCLEVISGGWNPQPSAASNLILVGKYFRNLNSGSISMNNNMKITMNGTAAQTFENVDTITNLTISNAVSVELTQGFTISNNFTISAGAGTVFVDKIVTLPAAAALTIPSTATVEIKSGGILIAQGGITVNGVLKVDAGAKILVGGGKTVQVNSGGLLQLAGSSGSPAVLDANQGGSNTYTLSILSGASINANNFSISRTSAAGVNITGSVQAMSNGEFHYIASGGYAITINGAPSVPATWSGLGFFDDFSNGASKSFNVSTYTGSVITLTNWAGLGGGGAPNPGNYTNPVNSAKLSWGSQAAVALELTNRTSSTSPPGPNPPTTLGSGSADTLFGTFAFSLNQAATSTDITSVTVTLDGSNSAGDFKYVKLYIDAGVGGNDCVWQSATDTLVATVSPIGSPPKATVTLSAGQLSVASTTAKCIHVVLATSATALNGDTVAVKIAGTSDVANSQAYSFSNAAIPPVEGAFSTITSATTLSKWNGGNGTIGSPTNWNANPADWTPNGTPPTTAPLNDCQIGAGYSYPTLNTSMSCRNLELPNGGQLDWGSTANTFTVTGSLTLGSSYTFSTTTTAASIVFASTTDSQSITGTATYPGSVTINNTAAGQSVTVQSSWTISGNLTITAGNLIIASGQTLTVGGNVAVNGGTLTIQPGGTLKFSTNNSTLTVASGATLSIVGNSSQNAVITSSSTATAYKVTINAGGTIKAKYYGMSNLGTPGLTVSGTIDSTNNLSYGSFTCPIGSGTLLKLNVRVPGASPPTPDAMDHMTFDKSACSATATSIDTTGAPAFAGGLTITNYSGNLSNCCTTATTYPVVWSTPTNTLQLTQNSTGPASINQGSVSQIMGRFKFQQTAGGFATTNITSIKLTMTGTGTASDISAARLFFDSACNGAAGSGTQLGTTQVFAGTPATATFSGFGTSAPVTISSTPCIRVEYDVASGAIAGDTVGAKIAAGTDVVNDQSYAFNASFAPPVDLGTPSIINGNTITWTGTTSTAWATTTNWNLARLPTNADNCIINSATNSPVISAAGAVCKSVTIGNGTLTINAAQNLDIYGSLTNTGTLTNNGTITLRDTGAASSQTLSSSSALSGLLFNKTLGGTIGIGNNALTINSLSIPAAQSFTFTLGNADVLTLPNGLAQASATFQMNSNSKLSMGNNQAITLSGGTFQVAASNSAYGTQSYANSGWIAPTTAGNRWSFTVTGGTVDLQGAILDTIGGNGLNMSGASNLLNLNAVQFLNMVPVGSGYVAALQFNNTGGLLNTAFFTANSVGFNWGSALNSYWSLPPSPSPPTAATAYNLIVTASLCNNSNNPIVFNNWWGDFWSAPNTPDPATKVSAVAACPVTILQSSSPVNMLSFKATPYKDAVVLDWSTGLEVQHQGFNVYRSMSPTQGFAQVNASLIRNPVTSGTVHGTYQFYDRSVTTGVTYYYQLEDIAVNGTRTMHGPVFATPLASLAAAPAPAGGSVIGSAGQEAAGSSAPPSSPTAFAAGQRQLATGVLLLSETAHSMRLRIDVPAFTAVAAEQAPYKRLSIPGYSVTTDAALPELPQRVVMVEIPASGSASTAIVGQTHSVLANYDIAPALTWTQVNGALTSSWVLNSTFYATNQSLPASPISLGAITQSLGHTYLPVIVQPIAYNPVARTLDSTTQVVVDVDLAGAPAWNIGSSIGVSGPWAYEGGLRIDVLREGLYQLGYNDLVNAGANGPFQGAISSHLRLYSHNYEIPLDVTSPSGTFSPGDTIRFFAPYVDGYDSSRNSLVLVVDSVAGVRVGISNGSPVGIPAGRAQFFYRHLAITNPLFGFFNEPYGENLDHVVWARIFAPIVNPGDDTLTSNVTLPNLVSGGQVTINAVIKGSPGPAIANGVHHLRLLVNGVAVAGQDQFFVSNVPATVTFQASSSLFVAGANQLKFQVVGDLYGDYDILTVGSYTIDYPHRYVAESDVTDLIDSHHTLSISVGGFAGTDIVAYDVTDPSATAAYSGITTGPDGAGGTASTMVTGTDGLSRRVWMTRASTIPLPASIQLNAGSLLKSTTNGADVIFVGPAELLDAVAPLAALRVQQGFRVKSVDIESVYLEFGQGYRGADTLKAFIQYAATQWQAPALRYVVLVGDGSYDGKNELGFGQVGQVPVHLIKGAFEDFASDNWYAAFNAGDRLPSLSVGRIPGATPALVTTYVNKVLAYEAGDARPPVGAAAQFVVISDIDQNGGENFSAKASVVAGQIPSLNNSLHVTQINRSALTDAQLKTAIVNAFNSGSTFIHYMGHGAEDRWAGAAVFMNADADALTNTTYPIVVAMACLNGYFYDASPAYQSLSDRLLFNAGGGAIATWVSTSLTTPESQAPYQNALYQILAQNPGIRLGDAIRLAKIQGGWTVTQAEVVDSWTLLGDPMIQVNLPQPAVAAKTGAPPAASQQGDSSSGHAGFLSCGTINTGGGRGRHGGGGSGPTGAATAEFGLLVLFLISSRRMFGRVARTH